jgi:asparagine synthase (glutamine-hydrolysing)
VGRDCEALAKREGSKLGTFASLGLGGVVATQLWHRLYLSGGLCELPHVTHPPAVTTAVAPATNLAVA